MDATKEITKHLTSFWSTIRSAALENGNDMSDDFINFNDKVDMTRIMSITEEIRDVLFPRLGIKIGESSSITKVNIAFIEYYIYYFIIATDWF
jgi:hypothetical protein